MTHCIHEIFAEQAARTPHAIAAVCEDRKLTYDGLNRHANQLAHYLRSRGVGPETPVGICVERSLEMLVGLLGILKAGGAYVPLDPSYPDERLAFMLKDSRIRIVVAHDHLRQRIDRNVELISPDSEGASEENPENQCTPANLAYVMYTSGSTGVPKGVSIPHRGVVRLVKETNYARFDPEQVFLQFAPLSFDASTFEIWGSLLNGARLAVMPPGSASLAQLGAAVERYGVTTLWLTAGLFHQMADAELEKLSGLKQLLAGGDVLSPAHVEQVARELNHCQLINGYGPTENTTFTCCYPAKPDETFAGSVPIGFAISNTQVFILDEAMQPVAGGEPGELYIAGDGLARGYLNDAALTAERFVPHPFSPTPGARLYRTGDSVRRCGDGPIEFLGRLDQQVKIRGYRIELGEIETALAGHRAVRESVVLARPDAHGNKRLVAYVVHDERQSGAGDFESRHVEQWQTLYDETYRQTSSSTDFNTVGWNSSYTGKPIPPDEMKEWVDQTVARIRALQPRRVLEIGCGTGLLLFRIAPHCEAYYATDFSAAVIDQLESQIANLEQVTLSQREANDFSGLESESFDLVILNSVTQYFPSIDYLLEVLKGAVRVTRPGGVIFIGDVRNLDLLETFHASVELYKASDSLSVQELARRVQRAIREEDELLVDPVFFKAATGEFEKACSVRVMPKVGQHQNEMTKFRYDVVVSVGVSADSEIDADGLNARVLSDSQILDLINEAKPGSTVADLRRTVFNKTRVNIPQRSKPQPEQTAWSEYGNQRSQKSTFVSLVPELRAFLQTKLPAYMTPSAFVFLDRLPLTRNGKVDRQALPAPERSRPELAQPYVGPGNHTEEVLASLCADVLGIDRIGVYDDFFECGGHSLLATQVCARIRESFKVELSLHEFFIEPKIAALASLIEQRGANSPGDDAIPRLAQKVAPLSFGQQRLWFMNQLNPATPVHNIPVAIELSGQPDVDILTRCLNEIVRRHESLRTTIHQQDGKPIQAIAPSLTLALEVIDLTKLRRTDQEVEAQKVKSAEAQKPFDIAAGPLFRATLVRLGQNRNILLLTMHHIISDGWSMGVLLRELGALYSAYRTGAEPSLPELTIQYADFAVWQRERVAGSLDQQLSFWKQQLEGAPSVLQLPTDRARPAIKTFRGARHSLVLSKQLSSSLREFSRSRQVTPFMTLLAALSVLLSRYTDEEDMMIGSPIVNRPRTETETLIGFFLNTLALRTRPAKHSTFRELLENTRDMVLGAFANRDLPFEMLVEALNPARDASRTPLFQVFLNFLNFSDDRVSLPGLTAASISAAGVWSQPDESWSQFDMTLYARDFAEQLQFILVYNSDLFDRARMVTMLDQLRLLLDQIVAAPDKQISDYSLLDAESQAKLPDPRITIDEPRLEPITETILAQPRDHIAICKGEQKWTYAELASRAEHIARVLVADGLAKGEVVAVSGPPSFDLIALMLGVFRSGGVLLTLDPSLPTERRQLMLREAGAKRTLDAGALSAASAGDVELPAIDPNDPAYLFFTSGTTGVPKGVLGCHKGLSHFLKWQREEFAIGPEDACAHLTGLSFDVVLRDIFLPLTSGASLHLPDLASEVGASRILSWLERRQITALHTVPSVAQVWLNDVPEGVSLRSLRWAFFAGEPLNDSLVARWRAAFPESGKIVNLYGPTETTLAKCFYVVPDEPLFGVQPVGRALPETQALLLNASNNLCGIGELGEIVIRTPFRTLGYSNDQGARFQTNPFTEAADDLVYRTGDRGRYRPDGTLEILGRLDQQVKIRGVRVEPDEVTALLARHPAIDSCIVTACKDAHNENALAAYVVMAASDCPSSELRTYLSKHLPPAMVPSFFVIMPELPLTPNGKVDRRALPEPERSLPQPDKFVAPRDQTEQTVADIWSDVLGIKQFSVATDFFELGGHSLLATQIISRLRDTFQIELPVASIFENRTVAELSRLVTEARQQDVKMNPPAITILPRERRRRTL